MEPGHCVIIKYVPYVGDSKRALDEQSELMLGGTNTLVLLNKCEDSLLTGPIMLDLALLTDLCQRVSFCTDVDPQPQNFHPVLSLLNLASSSRCRLRRQAARWSTCPSAPAAARRISSRPAWDSGRRTTSFWSARWSALASRELGLWLPPVPCKKGPVPTAPSGYTGDANGHL